MKNYKDFNSASEFTTKMNKDVLNQLPFDDTQDFDFAQRGLIATYGSDQILKEDGSVLWDFKKTLVFQQTAIEDAPASVNPSLWRQAQLLGYAGLYEVIPGKMYQIRNFDLANITYYRGKTGWIVVDTGMTREIAEVAHEMMKEHVEDLPIKAIIVSHSHIDHFGGLRGLVSEEQIASGEVELILPYNFMEEAVRENVLLGNAMSRRSTYQSASNLQFDDHHSCGLGLGIDITRGTISLVGGGRELEGLAREEVTLDGVDFIFTEANETEATSEHMFYVPESKWFFPAEVISHNQHNLLTPRGAQIRSSLKWAQVIDRAIRMFGDDLEVIAGPHHWPYYGNEEAMKYMKAQRDLYKSLHDRTVNRINHGDTINELPYTVKLPEAVSKVWANRGYYGHEYHNTMAIYQYYLGYYSGNPTEYMPLTQKMRGEALTKYFGREKVMEVAKQAYDNGEYQLVAELVHPLVFANNDDQEARLLTADALEQIGYQQESGIRRNVYLTATEELRVGVPKVVGLKSASVDVMSAMPIREMMNLLAVKLDFEKADKVAEFDVNLKFTAEGEKFAVQWSEYKALNSAEGFETPGAPTIEFASKMVVLGIMGKQLTVEDAIESGKIKIDGDVSGVKELLSCTIDFEPFFDVIE